MNTPLLVCVRNYVEESYRRTAGDSIDYHTNYYRCISMLIAAGAQVDAVNRDGKTALLILCRIYPEMNGDTLLAEQSIRALLDAGANVNARAPKGYQPLHYAAVTANYVLARLLVAAGADVNSKGPDTFTPLDYVQNKLSKNSDEDFGRMLELTGTCRRMPINYCSPHESDAFCASLARCSQLRRWLKKVPCGGLIAIYRSRRTPLNYCSCPLKGVPTKSRPLSWIS